MNQNLQLRTILNYTRCTKIKQTLSWKLARFRYKTPFFLKKDKFVGRIFGKDA